MEETMNKDEKLIRAEVFNEIRKKIMDSEILPVSAAINFEEILQAVEDEYNQK